MNKYLKPRKYCLKLYDRKIGVIVVSRFEKQVRSSRQLYHEILGWAIDEDILEELDQCDIQVLSMVDTDKALIYHATLSDFAKYGVPVHSSRSRQICLPLQYWSISNEPSNS